MTSPSGVVLLAGRHETSRITYHRLSRRFLLRAAILEEPVSRRAFLRRRIERLGLARVAGQTLFRALVVPWLRREGRQRIAELKRSFDLDDREIPAAEVRVVSSANAPETFRLLSDLSPAAVVVAGTRILGRDLLAALPGRFLNIHAGMTPAYRGVHGAYWALANRDRERCGVTVHLLDEGIDTGPVVAQARVEPTPDDNFATYPLLQLATALPMLESAVERLCAGELLATRRPDGPSRLYHHPTIGEYWHARVRYGVR